MAAGFFLYYLFPSDAVKAYITSELKKNSPDWTMAIDHVRPGFPPGLKCNAVTLFQKDMPMIHADWVRIFPDFLTLMRPEKRFMFKGESHEGHFSGNLIVSPPSDEKDTPALVVESDLSGIQVRDISGIQDRSDSEISGKLDGKIIYGGKELKDKDAVSAKLTLTDCGIGLAEPIFDLETLSFSTIDAELEFRDKAMLIRKCVMAGTQVGGNLSGHIRLREPFEKSTLDIAGAIKPHPSFIANLGEGAALLLKQGSGADGFPFSIRGTFDSPQFSLR